MGTSSRLATWLDLEMLRVNGASLQAPFTPDRLLPHVPDLSNEIGGRAVIRYLRANQLRRFLQGTQDAQYVTPTPYSPEEAVKWLATPYANMDLSYALLLDSTKLNDVVGPRTVRLGGGIEYILTSGFGPDAILDVSADGPSKWEIQVN